MNLRMYHLAHVVQCWKVPLYNLVCEQIKHKPLMMYNDKGEEYALRFCAISQQDLHFLI